MSLDTTSIHGEFARRPSWIASSDTTILTDDAVMDGAGHNFSSVTAEDNLGCKVTLDTVIAEPTLLVLDTLSLVNPGCVQVNSVLFALLHSAVQVAQAPMFMVGRALLELRIVKAVCQWVLIQ